MGIAALFHSGLLLQIRETENDQVEMASSKTVRFGLRRKVVSTAALPRQNSKSTSKAVRLWQAGSDTTGLHRRFA
jgi:hypothetical protein